MSTFLEINNIYKKIGSKQVLNGLSIKLDKGKVLGIMGPNGQGKTTLLNTIEGFLKPDSGNIALDGVSIGYETKKFISYLQDKNVFPRTMTIGDAEKLYKDFFDDFDEEKMNKYIEFMKLDKKMRISTLSKGMNEKFALALTLSRKAKLYMLDEPISGVDPITREKILDAILENLSEESSMIITTHYVGELERIFDEVAFLGEGTVVESGNAEDLRAKYELSIDGIYRKIFAE